MMEAAGLAFSAWQVRFSESPARKLTTGAPIITGSSGGTGKKDQREVYPHVLQTMAHSERERGREMEG